MTWNVLHASSVASGRWSNSGGGLLAIFCECFLDNLGAVLFSEIEVLSAADFASSGDMLDARVPVLKPFDAPESPMSSFLIPMPLIFRLSSVSAPAAAPVPEARLLPSIASRRRAQCAEPEFEIPSQNEGRVGTGGIAQARKWLSFVGANCGAHGGDAMCPRCVEKRKQSGEFRGVENGRGDGGGSYSAAHPEHALMALATPKSTCCGSKRS